MVMKHFSEDFRRRSLTASLVFAIVATLTSLTAIGWGIYAYCVSMALLGIVGGPVAGAIPYIMVSMGFVNLVAAARSIRVAVIARRVALGQVAKSVFKIAFNVAALLMPVLVIDMVCGVVLLCSAALAQLTSSSSLFAACFGYYSNDASRKDLNNVQSHLQCCGAQSPDNWAMLNPSSVPEKQSLPMSCCPTPHFSVEYCQYSSKMVPGTVAQSVVYSYHHGCIDEAVTFLYSQHFWSAGVAFAMALLMLLVAVCQRLAQTSARAAIESGDSGGPAPAWLFHDPRDTSTEKRPQRDPSSSLWRDESSGWPRSRDGGPTESAHSKLKSGYRRFTNSEDNEATSESEDVTGLQQSWQPTTSIPPPPQIRPIKHIRLPDSDGVSTKEGVYEVYSTSGQPAYYGPDGLSLNQEQVQVLRPPAKEIPAGNNAAKRSQPGALPVEQRSLEDQDSARKKKPNESLSRKKKKFSFTRVIRKVVRKSRSGGSRRRLIDERASSRNTSGSDFALKESKHRGSVEEGSRLLRPSWTTNRKILDETSLKESDQDYSPRRSRRNTPRGVQRMRISEDEKDGHKGAAAESLRQIRCLHRKANEQKGQTDCQAIFPAPSSYRTSSDMPTEMSVTPIPSSDEEYAMGAICRSSTPSKTSTCSAWSSRESSPERQLLFREAASQTTFDDSSTTSTSQNSTPNATLSAAEAVTSVVTPLVTEQQKGVALQELIPQAISMSFVITDERMPVEVPRRSLSHKTSESARDVTLSQLTMNFLRHSSSALQSTEGRTGTMCLSQRTNSSQRSVSLCALDESGEATEPKRLRLEDEHGKVDRGVPNDSSAEEGLLSDSVDGSWREDSATELSENFDAPVPPTPSTPHTPKKVDVYPLFTPEVKSGDFGFFDPFCTKAAETTSPDDENSSGQQKSFSLDEEYRADTCFVARSHPELSFNDVISSPNFLELSPALGCTLVLNSSRENFEFCQEDILEKSDDFKCGMDEIESVFETANEIVASHASPSLHPTPPPQMLADDKLNFIFGLKDDVSSWFAVDASRGQESTSENKANNFNGTVQDCIKESSKPLIIAVPNHNSIQLLYEGSSKPRESSEILLEENNAASIWETEKAATQTEDKIPVPNTPGSTNVEVSPALNEHKLAPQVDQNSRFELTKATKMLQSPPSFSPFQTKDSCLNSSRSPSKASVLGKFRSCKRSSQNLLTALMMGQNGTPETPFSSRDSIHEHQSINMQSVAPAIASTGIIGTRSDSLTASRHGSKSNLRDKASSCSKHCSRNGLFKRQHKINSAKSSNVQIVPTNLKEVFCTASAPVCPEALMAVSLSLTSNDKCFTGVPDEIKTRHQIDTVQGVETKRIGTNSGEIPATTVVSTSNIPTSKQHTNASQIELTNERKTEIPDRRGFNHRLTTLSTQNSIKDERADLASEDRHSIDREAFDNEDQIATITKSGGEILKSHSEKTLGGKVPSELLEINPTPDMTDGSVDDPKKQHIGCEGLTDVALVTTNEPSIRFGNVKNDDLTTIPQSIDKTSVCSEISETLPMEVNNSADPNGHPKTNIPCLYLPDSSSTDTSPESANFPVPQLDTTESMPDHAGGKVSDHTSSPVLAGKDSSTSRSDEKRNSNEPLKLVPSRPSSIQSITTVEDHQRTAVDTVSDGVEEGAEATSGLQKSLKASNVVFQGRESTGESGIQISSERQGNETKVNTLNTAGSSGNGSSWSESLPNSYKETKQTRTQLGNRLHLPILRFPHQVVNLQDCWNSYAGDRPPPTEGEFSSEIARKRNSLDFDSAVSEVLVSSQNPVVESRHPIPRYGAVLDMDWALSGPEEDTGCNALSINKIELPLVPFLEFISNLDPSTVDPRILRKILEEVKSQLDRGDDKRISTALESQSPCRQTDQNQENAMRTTTDGSCNDAEESRTLDRRKEVSVRASRSARDEFEDVGSTYRLSQGTIMSGMGISLSQFTTHIFVRDSETNTSELSSNSSLSSYKCNNCDCWANAQTTAEDSSYPRDSQHTTRKNHKETNESLLDGGQSCFQSNSSHFDSASECTDFLRTSDFESAESTSSTSTITGTSEACTCAPENKRRMRNCGRRETFHREDSEKS